MIGAKELLIEECISFIFLIFIFLPWMSKGISIYDGPGLLWFKASIASSSFTIPISGPSIISQYFVTFL